MPAELETESLVAITLDHAEKDHTADSPKADSAKKEKPQLKLATGDDHLSGEVLKAQIAVVALRFQGDSKWSDC